AETGDRGRAGRDEQTHGRPQPSFQAPLLAAAMSAIEELVTELSRLPTIGRKSAWRLTYHLLKQPSEQSKRLARALETLADRVRRCERCFNLTEDALCAICADPRR